MQQQHNITYTPTSTPTKVGDELIFAISKDLLDMEVAKTSSFFSDITSHLELVRDIPSIKSLVPSLNERPNLWYLGREDLNLRELPVHHFFEWRGVLEANDSPYVHFIPYLIITRPGPTGELTFYTYQRTSKVGEQQLAGNYSLGIGGHPAVEYENLERARNMSILELVELGLNAEYNEEVDVYIGDETKPCVRLQKSVFTKVDRLGFIYDTSNVVGQRHLGVVYHMHIPSPCIRVEVKEAELRDCGFVSYKELSELTDDFASLENWSRLAADVISTHFSLEIEEVVN